MLLACVTLQQGPVGSGRAIEHCSVMRNDSMHSGAIAVSW